MEVTKCIKLTGAERLSIQRTLELIDRISDASNKSMREVIDYLLDEAELKDDYTYIMTAIMQIDDI